jgi:serine/threonine protein phosphatase PrpC
VDSSASIGQLLSLAPRRRLTVNIERAAQTDKGRRRSENQDSFLIDARLGLAVLCDGMGGHHGGARASTLAARVFRQAINAGMPLIRGYLDRQCPEPVTKKEIVELLEAAVNAASSTVHEDGRRLEQCAGMGTTLVAVLVLDNHAFIVNVGDSRAYLLRNRSLQQLTRDHSVYDELLRSGYLPAGSRPQSGLRNILTRVVGTHEEWEPDTLVIDIAKGDRILLCTDGVHQYFDAPEGSPSELERELLETDGQRAADRLIEVANARGGCDDMTALVLTAGSLGDYESGELDALSERYEAFLHSPLFAALDARERSGILGLADVECFRTGDTVVGREACDGDLYVLLRGAVVVDPPAPGSTVLHQGQQAIGRPWLHAEDGSTRAVATQPTELLVLPRQGLFALFRSDPELAKKMLRQFEA